MNTTHTSRPPENNLIWAILSTVLCCMPLGVVAIVKASKVETLWYQGRHDEAIKAADDAKKWSIYSAVSIAVIIGVIMILGFIGALADGAFNY